MIKIDKICFTLVVKALLITCMNGAPFHLQFNIIYKFNNSKTEISYILNFIFWGSCIGKVG